MKFKQIPWKPYKTTKIILFSLWTPPPPNKRKIEKKTSFGVSIF